MVSFCEVSDAQQHYPQFEESEEFVKVLLQIQEEAGVS
jgi:hypothetical protein